MWGGPRPRSVAWAWNPPWGLSDSRSHLPRSCVFASKLLGSLSHLKSQPQATSSATPRFQLL